MIKQNNYDVGIYCRLSRDDNNGNSESMRIQNQRDMLVQYAEEKGWNLSKIYCDDGYSGTTFERPAFKEMISDATDGKINLILTKDLSRLGRNYIQLGQYTDFFFPDNNIRYIAVNDNYDTASGDDDIAPFKNIINEWYAKDISKKVRSSRISNAKKGNFMGSKAPYGYSRSKEDKHKLVVNEEVSDIVKRIFEMFSIGSSARQIAITFNNEGIICPKAYYYHCLGKLNPNPNESNLWGSATVLQILKNQVYIGNMAQCKRSAPSFKSKKRNIMPEESWIVVENTHEAIIDIELWNKVHKIFSSKTHQKPTKDDGISLFSGLLKCADCGSPLVFTTKRYAGREYRVYRCGRYANNGTGGCTIHTIALEDLKGVILADIRKYTQYILKDEESFKKELMTIGNAAQQKELATAKSKMRKLESREIEIENLVQKLFEEKVSGDLPQDLFKKLLSKYETERREIKNNIEQLQSTVCEFQTKRDNTSYWLNLIRKYLYVEKLDREIVVELIDYIEVSERYKQDGITKQDIKIYYNFIGCLEETA